MRPIEYLLLPGSTGNNPLKIFKKGIKVDYQKKECAFVFISKTRLCHQMTLFLFFNFFPSGYCYIKHIS